eukprot:gnl/MRDRNA2_/MRDRNA2_135732_c0_seq1.p1 gnl/MRDRNA2_/MRDRNA2_135732_c0~~gnl/MRDRNA2_/MRDRNA2_135732_c0_seq1.p1  ORF type:complete len:254 (+),score=41.97 gnl/MRDRNA2_/MRDRNA2_135732_c0_seq1:80-841(+)
MEGCTSSSPSKHVSIGETTIGLGGFDDACRHGCADTTGFELWLPATVAAAAALQHRQVRGQSLIELGCGLGALGIFCAKLEVGHIVMTDKEVSVLDLARLNAQSNGVAGRCDFVAWDFQNGQSPWRHSVGNRAVFDLAVGSDILFLDKLADPLFKAVQDVGVPHAVIGHERRRAVYRAADGSICFEPEDSALALLLGLSACWSPKCVPSTPTNLQAGDFPQADAVAVELTRPSTRSPVTSDSVDRPKKRCKTS